MAPKRRQAEITYRVPEPFVKALVTGACYNVLAWVAASASSTDLAIAGGGSSWPTLRKLRVGR